MSAPKLDVNRLATVPGRASSIRQAMMTAGVLVLAGACALLTQRAIHESPDSPASQLQQSPRGQIPPTFFGINVIGLRFGTPMPGLRIGAWRSFDSYWYRIEPTKGDWRFEELDREIAWANARGVKMLLLLGNPPTWASSRPADAGWFSGAPNGSAAAPRNIEDWGMYVRALAARYKGRIEGFELWNEPDQFFAGDPEELAALSRAAHSIIKEVDSTLVVVSPAVTSGGLSFLERFLKAGGRDTFDVLAVHFYVAPRRGRRTPRPPEEMLPRIETVRRLMATYGMDNVPLWNTETGWAVSNSDLTVPGEGETYIGRPLSPVESSAFVARAYLLSWAAGVQRLYWYSWGAKGMSLVEPSDGTPKPAARAYDEVQRWLKGSTMRGCTRLQDNTWNCVLERADGKRTCALWNSSTQVRPIPAGCPTDRFRDLEGNVHRLRGGTLRVYASPVLLESAES